MNGCANTITTQDQDQGSGQARRPSLNPGSPQGALSMDYVNLLEFKEQVKKEKLPARHIYLLGISDSDSRVRGELSMEFPQLQMVVVGGPEVGYNVVMEMLEEMKEEVDKEEEVEEDQDKEDWEYGDYDNA
ncbi:hypothetical protein BXZ70DRAFT_1075188 [Cristinia sonorae]|uniref:Uncharacterized protein n=1 Tax=Cristinia sonorae TaxID=1940300 RepID=A0A8K0XTZ9_9AGAR|nr:hypothetical protein BXZ70DRAFT_1075188 [Cristinia sonorae]